MTDRETWIATQLNADSVELEVVRSSPTSGTFRVQAGDTRAYFKACRGPAAHEPALMALLHARVPDLVPVVLGVDTARGWVLLADAGPTVREVIRADGDHTHSGYMLDALVNLQDALISLVDDLRAIGVPERRLDQLPQLYDELIADGDWLTDLSAADRVLARDFAPRLRELCAALGAFKLPLTLHHDDFHSGNVAVKDGTYRIFDFGESFISLPWGSLLIALRDAKYILKYDQPMLDALSRQAAREWRLPQVALPALFQIAALHRALSWRDALQLADEATRAADGDAVAYWLMTCVNNTPLEA